MDLGFGFQIFVVHCVLHTLFFLLLNVSTAPRCLQKRGREGELSGCFHLQCQHFIFITSSEARLEGNELAAEHVLGEAGFSFLPTAYALFYFLPISDRNSSNIYC